MLTKKQKQVKAHFEREYGKEKGSRIFYCNEQWLEKEEFFLPKKNRIHVATTKRRRTGRKNKMSDNSREYTKEEMRDMFMNYLVATTKYWLRESRTPDVEEKMKGLVFSILVAFDGGSADLPALDIVPMPHPEDQKFHEDEGDNWWKDQTEGMNNIDSINDDVSLHDMWYKYYNNE